ncbi:hypothetical protein Glove_212g76 [Diversispora epigaea]|uniref:Uncharacterized protein n=1 Tax=Diversispora epigaea TaxID=1348612 RepID=A0A397IIA8_9GLOM|nr:hypothetical protein Glove_212g76 [Diversispora epigaea]
MSNTITLYFQETSENPPYSKYFQFFPCENWSLHHYVSLVIDNYKSAEKREAHRTFFNILHNINNNHLISQEVRNIAQNLIKVGACYLRSSRSPACAEMDAFITYALVNFMEFFDTNF